MKHVSLFSGIGGFNLACDWLGIETILNCEIDKFCQRVLLNHWANVPIVEDVNNVEEIKRIVTNTQNVFRYGGNDNQRISLQSKEISKSGDSSGKGIIAYTPKQGLEGRGYGRTTRIGANEFASSLILTAGFPCQPFSNAGRKRGASDDRYLWPQTLAVINAIRPTCIVLENVAGILNMVFPDGSSQVASQTALFSSENDEIADYNTIAGGIDSDLRQAGYETLWLVIPACAVSAPHRRDRVWIVANSNRTGSGASRSRTNGIRQAEGEDNGQLTQPEPSRQSGADTNTSSLRQEQSEKIKELGWTRLAKYNERTIPDWEEKWYEVATRFCGVDARVSDRVHRLKALGNSIVPQVAYEIIRTLLTASQANDRLDKPVRKEYSGLCLPKIEKSVWLIGGNTG